MRPPIFVAHEGYLQVFCSVESAQRYIEPWYADEVEAYDSEGRLLTVTPGRFTSKIEPAEEQPHHRSQLQTWLVKFLVARKVPWSKYRKSLWSS